MFRALARPSLRGMWMADDFDDEHFLWLLDNIERVIRGEHVAYHLSGLLDCACRHQRLPLSPGQRDVLLGTLFRAQLAAVVHLPTDYSRTKLRQGVEGLAAALVRRADPAVTEREGLQARYRDWRDHARILQNDMHNLSLQEQMRERHVAESGAL